MDVSVDQMRGDDWEAVRSIYQEGISTGDATFEMAPPNGKGGMKATCAIAGLLPGKAARSSVGLR